MSAPTTTLVPFAQLPPCAEKCGSLFDANGACVPPAAPASNELTYANCFCNVGALQPWKSGPTGVCEYAGCDAAGFASIQGWFTSFCNAAQEGATPTSSSPGSTGTSGSSRGSSGSSGGDGGDWLSNHWQWVVMLVVLVVAIAGIWVGACIWRRRYLKRKDRMYELGKHAHQGPSGIIAGSSVNVAQHGMAAGPGSFMPGPPAVYEEKPKEKKKWTVNQRT